jgi:hypothetical protein
MITALVLFFVFGYQHDFARRIFIHTGSISIKSNPRDISIHINDKAPKAKLINIINNSYYIRGLRPKTYSVAVMADGFRTWYKEAAVHSGITTEFWNVLLLRNEYPRASYTITDVDDFFPAPEENLFACTKQLGRTQTVQVFDTKKNTITNTFLFTQSQFTTNAQENIEWSPRSTEMIIPIERINEDDIIEKDYSIAYTKDNTHYNLSDFIELDDLQFVRWDPKEKNVIYFLSQNTLWRAALNFPSSRPIVTEAVASDVLAYDFADDGLYVLTDLYEVWHDHDTRGEEFKKLTQFDIHSTPKRLRLDAYDTHRIIMIDDETRDLYLYNKGDHNIYTKKLEQNIIGAHFSDDGKKLLFYSPFEIFIYFTRDWDSQPIRREDTTYPIVRFSQLIDNVHFEKNYEHVIFTVSNEIKIAELDYRGNRNIDTIININDDQTNVINKHKMNRLYFVESYDDHSRALRSIEFPEKETIF